MTLFYADVLRLDKVQNKQSCVNSIYFNFAVYKRTYGDYYYHCISIINHLYIFLYVRDRHCVIL